MKKNHLINHLAIFKTNKNNEFIMLNLLNGLVDIINTEEFDFLKSIRKSSKSKDTIYHKKTIHFKEKLINRGYIMEDSFEEENYKKMIVDVLKRKYEEKKNNLFDLILIFSYKCNFSCPYCFERDINAIEEPILTFDMVNKIEEVIPNLKSLMFYGGEPFLISNYDIIKYVIKKYPNIRYRAITNGYNIDLFIDILQKISIDWIQITLDGYKETHDRMRPLKDSQIGTYDRIRNNIDLLMKHKIPVKIRMNVNKENLDECLALREELKAEYEDIASLSFELQPLFQHNHNDKMNIERKIYNHDNYSDNVIGGIENLYQNMIKGKKPFKLKYNNCWAETSGRIFDNYGDMYSCLVAVGKKSFRIGTYYPNIKYYSKSFLNRNIISVENCKSCKFSLLCGGGCAMKTVDKTFEFLPDCTTFFNNLRNCVRECGYELLDETPLLF